MISQAKPDRTKSLVTTLQSIIITFIQKLTYSVRLCRLPASAQYVCTEYVWINMLFLLA